MLTALLLGLLIGTVMGITGAGGGVLAVPALVTGLGWSMQQAAPVALIAMVGSAGAGAIEGLLHRLVRYRAAILIALISLPFTSLGILAAHALPQAVLMRIFVLIMLISAIRSLRNTKRVDQTIDTSSTLCALGPIDSNTGRFIWSIRTASVLASIGGIAGFMAGLLGVGGGFVIVPMLRRFTQLSIHSAVATALLIIALVSAGGVASNLAHGVELPLQITATFSAASIGGMLISRRFAHRLSAAQVQRAFALLLIVVAIGLGWQSFTRA